MSIHTLPQEVTEAIEKYYSLFDSDTGELLGTTEQLEQAEKSLKELENKSNEAMEWMLKVRTNEQSIISSIDAEIERLGALKNSLARKVEKMENLIERNFERIYGGEPMLIGNYKLSFRASEAVNITDEDKIPEELKKIKTTVSVDKTEIKKRLKA